MKVTDIKTAADMQKFMKNFVEAHATALNGLLDKLPDTLKKEIQSLHDSLNQTLKGLPPMEQVPAAQDAAWAFTAFSDAMVRMQEYSNSLLERLTSLKKELDAKATALNGLETQVAGGELLGKDKVKELCELAKSEGAASVRPEIVATRKSALELAGLPVPSDDVLGLPADKYSARLTTAKDNLAKLTAKGMKLGGKGDGFVKSMTWLEASEFAGQMTNIEDILPGTIKAGDKVDPLLGAGANQPQKASDAKAAPAIALV